MSARASSLKPAIPDLSKVPQVDEVGVGERAARFQTRSIKKDSKVEALRMVLAMIDLTTLEGQDTPGKVRQLCQKARHLHDALALWYERYPDTRELILEGTAEPE